MGCDTVSLTAIDLSRARPCAGLSCLYGILLRMICCSWLIACGRVVQPLAPTSDGVAIGRQHSRKDWL